MEGPLLQLEPTSEDQVQVYWRIDPRHLEFHRAVTEQSDLELLLHPTTVPPSQPCWAALLGAHPSQHHRISKGDKSLSVDWQQFELEWPAAAHVLVARRSATARVSHILSGWLGVELGVAVQVQLYSTSSSVRRRCPVLATVPTVNRRRRARPRAPQQIWHARRQDGPGRSFPAILLCNYGIWSRMFFFAKKNRIFLKFIK